MDEMTHSLIRQLQDQVQELQARLDVLTGPIQSVFPAQVNSKQWKERAYDNGTLSDFDDGRIVDSDSSPCIAHEVVGPESVMLEVIDRGTARYFALPRLCYGKVQAAWSSGNTITVKQCDSGGTLLGGPDITVTILSPDAATPSAMYINLNDVITYWPTSHNTGKATPLMVRRSVALIGKCSKTSGDAGSISGATSDCTFVYTIKDRDGNVLTTGVTPDTPRISDCAYTAPADDSPCIVYQDTDGTWKMFACTERPAGATLEVHVNPVWNSTDMQIDFDKHRLRVLDAADLSAVQSVLFYDCDGNRPA